MEHQLTVTHDGLPADQEMPNPRRRPRRRLVGRPVAERIRLECHDVSVRPQGERALPDTTAEGGRDHAGREAGSRAG